MAKRKKKEIEEIEKESDNDEIIEGDEEPRPTIPPFHWSQDGPRYQIQIELPDSKPGTRHFKCFKETDDLAKAKSYCLDKFEKENKTTFILDRAEHNKEILRYESS